MGFWYNGSTLSACFKNIKILKYANTSNRYSHFAKSKVKKNNEFIEAKMQYTALILQFRNCKLLYLHSWNIKKCKTYLNKLYIVGSVSLFSKIQTDENKTYQCIQNLPVTQKIIELYTFKNCFAVLLLSIGEGNKLQFCSGSFSN